MKNRSYVSVQPIVEVEVAEAPVAKAPKAEKTFVAETPVVETHVIQSEPEVEAQEEAPKATRKKKSKEE